MKSELDIESEKSPEQIEREIDAQRASIGNIVDALESKFTPGQMFDQAWGMIQNNGTTFLSNLGTSVRNNPVPAVLTSVGLLWLIMGQNRPSMAIPAYRFGPDQGRVGEWADELADGINTARDHLHQTTDVLKSGFQSLRDKVSTVGENVGTAAESISHVAHDTGDRFAHKSQALGQQLNHLLKEQPLMVAAAGIALGALLGAALPTTTTEQRYLGRKSAGLVNKVKQQAQEGYEAVRDTVTKTTEHVNDRTRMESGSPPAANASADLSKGLGTS
ncbi:uncharacterized protein DUF3618 [Pseudomonas sp. WPR_5_2]|uniref:DUF3618 domain-containing protein n=1 Tax=Pseudomonas sp. WPR_5_2 TaxID=1907371 RepID=UPI000EB1836B|nr:DUF3618 domain-containing protein [Pseudomonas sp. WPR_5_2]RKS27448.1 uncharacterized protein DUF3618 [Pseudomonas sp. WPR_5_2]